MRAESLEPKSLVTSSKLRTDSDRVCTCVLERVQVQRLTKQGSRRGSPCLRSNAASESVCRRGKDAGEQRTSIHPGLPNTKTQALAHQSWCRARCYATHLLAALARSLDPAVAEDLLHPLGAHRLARAGSSAPAQKTGASEHRGWRFSGWTAAHMR